MQASSPSRKISNKRTENITRKTSRIQDTLTPELREPSSSNDSDNNQTSLSISLPHTCNSNQLRVCVVNFCSLVSYNKLLELYQLIETHKPDIIIGTETQFNKDIDSREIFPPNYVYSPPVRKDQDSGEKRGGVVIAVNSNIISVEQSSPAECEIVWCNISHKSGSVVVGSFYRPPYTSVDYLEQLELSMNNIKQLSGIDGKYVLLSGDFNLPDIDWEEGSVKSNPHYTAAINWKMIDIANDFNLTQIVSEPTRQGNILDLLFTSHQYLVDKVYIVPGMSDYDAVISDINHSEQIHQLTLNGMFISTSGLT